MNCIFCGSELNGSTKPEHILPNALGGRMTTRRAICSKCNNNFGGTIDKKLTSQIEVIRNLLQLSSGTGKSPPGLRNISAGSQKINFRNDGTPELTGKPFEIEYSDDGVATVLITARSQEELQKHIPNIAEQLRISPDELLKQINAEDVSYVTEPVEQVHHRLSLGGEEMLRSVVKSCLVLWSTHVGNDEVSSPTFEDARNFVTKGQDAFSRNRIQMDSRLLPCNEALTSKFGDIINLIYISSDNDGRLIGHFTMFNAIGWQIVLSEGGASSNSSIGLISNPLRPSDWSNKVASEFNVEFSWLAAANFESFDDVQRRFSKVIALHFEMGRPRVISKIINDICEEYDLSEDQHIPEEIREQVLAEVSERLAFFALRLPHSRALSPAELKKLLGSNQAS